MFVNKLITLITNEKADPFSVFNYIWDRFNMFSNENFPLQKFVNVSQFGQPYKMVVYLRKHKMQLPNKLSLHIYLSQTQRRILTNKKTDLIFAKKAKNPLASITLKNSNSLLFLMNFYLLDLSWNAVMVNNFEYQKDLTSFREKLGKKVKKKSDRIPWDWISSIR